MPCHAGMRDQLLCVSAQDTVENVLASMDKDCHDFAVVTDEAGAYAGIFSRSILLGALLPVEVKVDGSAMVTLSAAPGIAQRLQKSKPLPVDKFVDKSCKTAPPNLPLWEGITLLLDNKNMPLVVVDANTRKPLGLMCETSVLHELERMQNNG